MDKKRIKNQYRKAKWSEQDKKRMRKITGNRRSMRKISIIPGTKMNKKSIKIRTKVNQSRLDQIRLEQTRLE